MKKIEDFTKDELISVIAIMKDLVDFSDGFGLSDSDSEKLNFIGSMAIRYDNAKYGLGFNLPKLED